jgi:protein-S-isoprenylcysteine O-methyltransferase Ste14
MAMIAGGPKRFFYEPAGLLFAGLFILYLIFERIFQAPVPGGEDRDQGSIMIIWATSSFTYLFSIADYYWLRQYWNPLEWNKAWAFAGCALFAGGLLLRALAMRTLGRFFTISVQTHSEQKLIKDGVYSRLRHPAYTGLLLIVLGFVTVFSSLVGYIAFVVLTVPGLLNRIRIEEQALTDMFGDAYREYSKQAKRLVPFIY